MIIKKHIRTKIFENNTASNLTYNIIKNNIEYLENFLNNNPLQYGRGYLEKIESLINRMGNKEMIDLFYNNYKIYFDDIIKGDIDDGVIMGKAIAYLKKHPFKYYSNVKINANSLAELIEKSLYNNTISNDTYPILASKIKKFYLMKNKMNEVYSTEKIEDLHKKRIININDKVSKREKEAITVGWSNLKNQLKRFEDLTKNIENNSSILDWGCGLGSLYDYLKDNEINISEYVGTDIRESVLEKARKKNPDLKFYNKKELPNTKFDYIIASGIFCYGYNENSLLKELELMIKHCNKSIRFNVLMTYYDDEQITKIISNLSHFNEEKLLKFLKDNLPYTIVMTTNSFTEDANFYIEIGK